MAKPKGTSRTGDQIMAAAREVGPKPTGRKPMTMILDALRKNAEADK